MLNMNMLSPDRAITMPSYEDIEKLGLQDINPPEDSLARIETPNLFLSA